MADGQYKITANFIDAEETEKVCHITGAVRDISENRVYPADVTFTCGFMQTRVPTLPDGSFVNNPPPCDNFTIKAFAGGQTISESDVSVGEGEHLETDIEFPSEIIPDPSLEDAIQTLRILSGITQRPVPYVYTRDGKIGLDDTIYILQDMAGLRAGTDTRSVKTIHKRSGEIRNITLYKYTQEGVEDGFQTFTTDEYGYLEADGLSEGIYSLIATTPDKSRAVRFNDIQLIGSDRNLKTLRMKQAGVISGAVRLEGGEGAYDAIVRGDGAYAYISHDTTDGKVSVIATSADTVETSIAIKSEGESGFKNPKGMAVVNGTLYVVNNGDSTVSMINTETNTRLVLDDPVISGGNGPVNLIAGPGGERLYVVHSGVGSVEILGY